MEEKMNQENDIQKYFNKHGTIHTSAPCRLDVSGTWDLPQFALPFRNAHPNTTNIALDLRTHCCVSQDDEGVIAVSDDWNREVQPADSPRYDGPFGLVHAIASYFGVDSISIKFGYEAPPKSGLGGSGVLGVVTIAALNELTDSQLSLGEIAYLAHQIEDGLRFSYTGMQDQCAAAFGGVNSWTWDYGNMNVNLPFWRKSVLSEGAYPGLEKRLVVAYTGKSHNSSDVNVRQVAGFFDGSARPQWLRINEIGSEFAYALKELDWEKAGKLITEEHLIRCDLVPERRTETAKTLQDIALKNGSAGFATTGAGKGGCVWALAANSDEATRIRAEWNGALAGLPLPEAKILPVKIAPQGLVVETKTLS